MRITHDEPKWSPYPEAALTAMQNIERDASFFMQGFGDEPPVLPPLPRYDRAVRVTEPLPDAVCIVTDLPSDGIPSAIGDDEPTIAVAQPHGGMRL